MTFNREEEDALDLALDGLRVCFREMIEESSIKVSRTLCSPPKHTSIPSSIGARAEKLAPTPSPSLAASLEVVPGDRRRATLVGFYQPSEFGGEPRGEEVCLGELLPREEEGGLEDSRLEPDVFSSSLLAVCSVLITQAWRILEVTIQGPSSGQPRLLAGECSVAEGSATS